MVKHQRVNLDNLFSSAEQVYQLTQAESEIERLQAEVKKLFIENEFYAKQVFLAEKEGRDGFDSEKYLIKKTKEVK